MNFTTINEQAMIDAATAIVGAEATNAIIRLYQLLDKAMYDGFELGQLEAQKDVEAQVDEAWDHGYDTGEADSLAEGQEKAEDAYVDGVADARARPELADAVIEQIIAERAKYAINSGYDASLVTDSGDEA
jgi:hypothetical protein